jgi:hypothetical protein
VAILPLFGLVLLPRLMQDTVVNRAEFDERFPIELTGEMTDDAVGSALMETLDWIRMHPYDLNSISLEELLSIPCVTLSGAQAVLEFRGNGGRFSSPDQLLTIGGGGQRLHAALVPFVFVAGSRTRGSTRHRVSLRCRAIEETSADPGTPGSPLRFLSRLVLEENGGLEAGGVFSKGAGERTADAFISGYAAVRGLGCVTDFLAGDYELESGQGLVFWRGPTAVRNLWSLRVREGLAIVPHRSSDETRFLRGLAIAASVKERWRGVLFFSDRSYGANVDSGGEATGFFRGEYSTAWNVAKKDALRERLFGIRGEYSCAGVLTAGCTVYRSSFDRSFTPADRMRFSGDRAVVGGADVSGRFGVLSLSGECAFMRGGAHAFLWSIALVPGGTHMLMIRCRDYQPEYDNPHACGEGEEGETRNERGVTAALRLLPSSGSRLECFVDVFEHPWPTPRAPLPRRGVELTVSVESAILRGGTLSVRCSRKSSYDHLTSEDLWGRIVRSAGGREESHYRCEISCRAGNRLGFSTTVEYAGVSTPGGEALHGILLGGDLCVILRSFVSLDTRFSLFHTDGYGACLYEYESGLPGLISLPPLYGHGLRWYMRLRCTPAQWADLAIRYAATVKEAFVGVTAPFHETPAGCTAQIGVQADIRLP